jgi:hypothetical protein
MSTTLGKTLSSTAYNHTKIKAKELAANCRNKNKTNSNAMKRMNISR